MKIVQTSWSGNQSSLLKFNYSWLAPEYHLMAWCLSCLQLRKYYDDVVLHTDSITAKILIDALKLPYTDFFCDLDKFKEYPVNLFSVAKIDTYSKQRTPFLHIDGDVFIWKPFDEKFLSGDLIAQNLEVGTVLYNRMISELEQKLIYFSEEIEEEKSKSDKIYAYNAGIFGGNDLDFFERYTSEAKKMIVNNHSILPKVNLSIFNVYCEQYLFYCIKKKMNRKVEVLFNDLFNDDGYNALGGMIDVPFDKQYIHLVGQLKKSKGVCSGVAERLRRDYPEYYYRIISLFKGKKRPLFKDYYQFTAKNSESFLTKRHHKLKCDLNANQLQALNNNIAQINSVVYPVLSITENAVTSLKNIESNIVSVRTKTKMICDAVLFEEKLSHILKSKFATYSKDYLYARDLMCAQNIESIFSNEKDIYKKQIVADELNEIIASKYDWMLFVNTPEDKRTKFLISNKPSFKVSVSVIPECDQKGYSIMWLDVIDFQLVKLLKKKPKSIKKVIEEMKKSFDISTEAELTNEFEQLIFGRIKLALNAKALKAA